jgi:hypothetical protein
MPTQP